jgi:DNA-binding GntR family transcriptional regulator
MQNERGVEELSSASGNGAARTARTPPTPAGFVTAKTQSEPTQALDWGASTQHAYEELRRQILHGELSPGATFSQVQLSTQLGVSRTPLREAVRLLQMEGLLRAEPRRRVRVSPLSTEDFEDLYAIRIALESLAVRLTIPELSEAELAEIKLAYLEWAAAVSQGDVAAWRESHRRFHFGLYAHGGTRLLEQLADLWDHAERYRLLQWTHAGDQTQLARLAHRDHAGILEAAQHGHAALCATRMAEHLARTALMTLVQVDHNHEPTRVRAALAHASAEEPTAAATPRGRGARSTAAS